MQIVLFTCVLHKYENLVITDIMKGAFNKGIMPEIYFFRDSHGNEVDLFIREKGAITPVEIKSAATFSVKSLSCHRMRKSVISTVN